jgi:hypothetical protein
MRKLAWPLCLVLVVLLAVPVLRAGAGAAEPPAWPGVQVVELRAGQELRPVPGAEFVIRAGRVGVIGSVYDLTAGVQFEGDQSACRGVYKFGGTARFAVRGTAELADGDTGKVLKRVDRASLWDLEVVQPERNGIRVKIQRPFSWAFKAYPVPDDPYWRWGGHNGRTDDLGVLSGPLRLRPGTGAGVWSGFSEGPEEGVQFTIALEEGRLAVGRQAAYLPGGHLFVVPPEQEGAVLRAATGAIVVVRPAAGDTWGVWRRVCLKQGDVLAVAQGTLLTLVGGRAQTKDDCYCCLNSRYRGCGRPLSIGFALREADLCPGSLLFATGDMRSAAGPGGAEFLVRGVYAVNAELPADAPGWRWERVVLPVEGNTTIVLGPGAEAVVPTPRSASAQAGPGGGLADLGRGRDLGQGAYVGEGLFGVTPSLVMAPRGDGRGLLLEGPVFVGWARGPYSVLRGDAR